VRNITSATMVSRAGWVSAASRRLCCSVNALPRTDVTENRSTSPERPNSATVVPERKPQLESPAAQPAPGETRAVPDAAVKGEAKTA
jgi:hypothetical protein